MLGALTTYTGYMIDLVDGPTTTEISMLSSHSFDLSFFLCINQSTLLIMYFYQMLPPSLR